MRSGWRVGSIFGIPLFIDYSWFLIVIWVTIISRQDYIDWGTGLSWGAGFAIALLLFTSVLLHELGHSLVAQAQGIKVNSITLFLFGGIASIDRESKTPNQAFQVAIAGPLVSLMLFFLLSILTLFLPQSNLWSEVIQRIAGINLVLAIFNMIPGLPLDGGQVLKAAVWKATGNRFTGTRWAARSGQFLGISAIILGIINLQAGGLWIALIGYFALQNASSYTRLTDLQEVLIKVTAAEAMTREFRVVDADLTLREFADQYLIAADVVPIFFAASDGRYRGLVSVDTIRDIERSLWDEKTVHDLVEPLDQLTTALENTILLEVIKTMEAQQLPYLTILSPAGAVAGTIDRGDVVQAVAKSLNVILPQSEIQRIKSEGRYPTGLPLAEIAKKTDLL